MYNLVIPALTDKNLQFLWEIYTICKVRGTKGDLSCLNWKRRCFSPWALLQAQLHTFHRGLSLSLHTENITGHRSKRHSAGLILHSVHTPFI